MEQPNLGASSNETRFTMQQHPTMFEFIGFGSVLRTANKVVSRLMSQDNLTEESDTNPTKMVPGSIHLEYIRTVRANQQFVAMR